MPLQPFQATRDFTKASTISQVDKVEASCGRLRETIIEVDRLLQGEETVVFAVRDRAESRQFEPSLILPWRFSLGGAGHLMAASVRFSRGSRWEGSIR